MTPATPSKSICRTGTFDYYSCAHLLICSYPFFFSPAGFAEYRPFPKDRNIGPLGCNDDIGECWRIILRLLRRSSPFHLADPPHSLGYPRDWYRGRGSWLKHREPGKGVEKGGILTEDRWVDGPGQLNQPLETDRSIRGSRITTGISRGTCQIDHRDGDWWLKSLGVPVPGSPAGRRRARMGRQWIGVLCAGSMCAQESISRGRSWTKTKGHRGTRVADCGIHLGPGKKPASRGTAAGYRIR